MSIEESNIATVQTLLAAIERFDVAAAGALYHPDVVQTEKPNKLYASGQVRNREKMLEDMPKGAKVLRSQRYPIDPIFGSGDKVTVETRWEGILNVPLGRLLPGDAMAAHVCMVFTLKDGKVIGQVNYDCYEDFGAVG
jgi:ketosteroid isomerase-like protein